MIVGSPLNFETTRCSTWPSSTRGDVADAAACRLRRCRERQRDAEHVLAA